MTQITPIQEFVILALPILFAITFHEVAHGWVALKLGDKTALMLGRLTLNPLKHIDPIGTILVPTLLFFLGGFIFGWAKPVPITYENLKNPKRDMAIVALAGPMSNLLMAFAWACIEKIAMVMLSHEILPTASFALVLMGQAGILINLVIMILNLIPIPPLDGSRVVYSFMHGRLAWYYYRIEPFGFFILLFLIATGVLGAMMGPPIIAMLEWFQYSFGLPSIPLH